MANENNNNSLWEAYKYWDDVYTKKYEEIKRNDPYKIKPIDPKEYYKKCDKPGTMDNATATIFYIIIMIVGAIFYDRLIIWAVATAIYLKHIFRHEF